MPRERPTRLFVSYSHNDEKYLDELRKYLEVERRLDLWSDERIEAGEDWREQIRDALARADAAILLVSQDFLSSEFIRNHELPSLLESVRRKKLRLFLIPVGASTWRSAVIERFQWVHDPAQPLRTMRPAQRERALVDINQKITEALLAKASGAAHGLETLCVTSEGIEQALREALPAQYELRREVARGQNATVFEAYDQLLGRTVAIKAFEKAELSENSALYEFHVRSTAGLKHRNICSVYSVQMQRLPNYVVTEFIAGESLAAVLQRIGRCPLEQALDYFSKIGDALQYAHDRDLLHNRLRPAHVIIDPGDNPVISGFHATLSAPSVRADDPTTLEDQRYMAPETREGQPVGRAADQYLLGLMLYEMLAGKPFIAAKNWGELAAQLARIDHPRGLDDDCNCAGELGGVLERMLAKDPAQRYPSISMAVADAWSISGSRLNRRMRGDIAQKQAELARSSYKRCLQRADLYENIYRSFFCACPQAGPLFEKTDLSRQYQMLHHAIVLMLAFHANPTNSEPTILSRVALRHKQLGVQIPASWFDAFSTAIAGSVAQADPEFNDESREAWVAVLDGGTKYMRSFQEPAVATRAAVA
ncbi:MAG TPA: protein kinase [Povalibacter sp.]|uniref:protein kinase domain-containing protein n=1 Tax=Povalibacter sp. TaxID=1962978 RepID=UPI002CC8D4DB|nr:protein kinase [Povalibacter sp.]HMN47361.1 protein kinase [Povalibacter sp.]